MMTSLSQKMAILEPTLMLVELPEDDALGRRFFEACGFTRRDVLTDYTCAAGGVDPVGGVDLVAEVAAAELVSREDFEAVPELDRCWQRSPQSVRNLRDRPRGLAVATDRGFEAWLLHRGDGDAEKPLPFLAAPPAGSPLAVPALPAVSLFHFFFAWNDFFGPLIYLAGNRNANPITVGLTEFNGLYSSETQLILAAAIISMILPLAIFFLAQRVFIQGIVITGVDK